MTVCRKVCSQNRSDNAFTCVTPLRYNEKTYFVWQLSNLQGKTLRLQFSCNSALARAFFSQTNPKTKLNYCYGTRHRSLLSFAFPSLQCVVSLFSSVAWTNSSGILWAVFPRKWIIRSGPPFLISPKCIFCLREACAQLAQANAT